MCVRVCICMCESVGGWVRVYVSVCENGWMRASVYVQFNECVWVLMAAALHVHLLMGRFDSVGVPEWGEMGLKAPVSTGHCRLRHYFIQFSNSLANQP